MSEQHDNHNSNRKFVYCRNGCGIRIFFDDKMLSKNGIHIPLEYPKGIPHECPLRNQNEWKPTAQNVDSNFGNTREGNKETKHILTNVHTRSSDLFRLSEIMEYSNKQIKTILTEYNDVKNQLEKIAQGIEELKRIHRKQE